MEKIKVLHIGHSAKWRGGENQVRLLIERMNQLDLGVEHHLAFPKKAIIFDRLEGHVKGILPLPSNKPIDLRSVFKIVSYCKKNKIEILHTHSGNSHSLGFLVKKLFPSLKLVVHRRVDNKINKKLTTKAKYLSDDVDHFIGISNAIVDILKEYGVNEGNISFIPSSVDDSPYKALDKVEAKLALTKKCNFENERPLIGFISALDNQKNPELFVEILNQLKILGIEFNAIIAGTGKQSDSVEFLIKEYDLTKYVKMLGFVEKVSPIFSALDIFVLPSRNEGLGTVLLEAALSKSALVASNVGGIGEIVIEQKTGRLIENISESTDFVLAIKELIQSSSDKNILVNNAIEHVNSSFSLDKMAKDTAEVYRSLK